MLFTPQDTIPLRGPFFVVKETWPVIIILAEATPQYSLCRPHPRMVLPLCHCVLILLTKECIGVQQLPLKTICIHIYIYIKKIISLLK